MKPCRNGWNQGAVKWGESKRMAVPHQAPVGASPVLSAAGLVMISPANASPDLTSDLAGNPGPDYHPGYFRYHHEDSGVTDAGQLPVVYRYGP